MCTKYRRIPKCEGHYQGQVPKCSLLEKLNKTRDLELPFSWDLSQVVGRTPQDTPALLYTRASPWPNLVGGGAVLSAHDSQSRRPGIARISAARSIKMSGIAVKSNRGIFDSESPIRIATYQYLAATLELHL